MFFYASKIFWLFAEPVNCLLLLAVLGVGLGWTRFAMAGRRLTAGAALLLAICGFSPLGLVLMSPLEQRFPRLDPTMPAPTGIIVLGGGIDEILTQARDQPTLAEAGGRMTQAAALALRFPRARLVFSGGSAAFKGSATTESSAARRLWRELGVPAAQLSFEDHSRNTYENAIFTQRLLKPEAGDVWLLVTSAYHMPRAIGIFRRIGFAVTPFPVDYRTLPWPGNLRPENEASQNLRMVDIAMREWIGLVAYRLTGRTDALFPSP